jgi:hypothetical protein
MIMDQNVIGFKTKMITVTPYFADRTERKGGITEGKTGKNGKGIKILTKKIPKLHIFLFLAAFYMQK